MAQHDVSTKNEIQIGETMKRTAVIFTSTWPKSVARTMAELSFTYTVKVKKNANGTMFVRIASKGGEE